MKTCTEDQKAQKTQKKTGHKVLILLDTDLGSDLSGFDTKSKETKAKTNMGTTTN